MKIEPVILEGKKVKLEPLKKQHLEPLCEIGLVEEIWQWYPFNIKNKADMKLYIEDTLIHQNNKTQAAFVIIDKVSKNIVGSTRFMNIDAENKRVEIGSTWINPAWQRTYINTEAKFLMLRHAFEIWNCIRVELKTDALNEKSRRAILRLGAKEEGILRRHIITESGRYRDTVYFSILDFEWLDIKNKLLKKINS